MRSNHIVGVMRANTSLRRGLEAAYSGVRFADVAQRKLTRAGETDVMFDVVAHMARRRANMAVVVSGAGRPRAAQVSGIISMEHVADSVAESIRSYG